MALVLRIKTMARLLLASPDGPSLEACFWRRPPALGEKPPNGVVPLVPCCQALPRLPSSAKSHATRMLCGPDGAEKFCEAKEKPRLALHGEDPPRLRLRPLDDPPSDLASRFAGLGSAVGGPSPRVTGIWNIGGVSSQVKSNRHTSYLWTRGWRSC